LKNLKEALKATELLEEVYKTFRKLLEERGFLK